MCGDFSFLVAPFLVSSSHETFGQENGWFWGAGYRRISLEYFYEKYTLVFGLLAAEVSAGMHEIVPSKSCFGGWVGC